MIEISNLTKSYGPIEALRGVSFHVAPGEVVGLLGPNGAGKSTAIKIITGYLHPDSGEVKVDGLDVLTHTREVQARIGYLPENAPLYPELSVQAYLKMMADLREIPREEQPAHLSEAIYATGLTEHLTRPIKQLSKGFRQRVGLAQAILHQPRLLIFDEPTVGLDPASRSDLLKLLLTMRSERAVAVLWATHLCDEVGDADRVIVMHRGKVLADTTPAKLMAAAGAATIEEAFLAMTGGGAGRS